MSTGAEASEATPSLFGPYRLRRILGEGAMGRVWLAWETAAQREVALKVLRNPRLRSGFDQRFAREIRLLGALEHPNIARLYAAGTVEEGHASVPYLAMEYVRGQSLRDSAQSPGLSMDQRLALIATIARAMHYAHTRGVVHRDLKPENIVVDDHGAPRVLDFGIAHVTGNDEATQMTLTGEILGTVAYMSPEQLSGSPTADPRMDVYALGVVAYELISGALPHPGLSEMSMTAAILTATQEAPRPLSKAVPAARGDVETIVMKAIATDQSQRYASAADLAADIERYLARQPIAARPPSLAYVAALFVRRHKALAAGAAVAVASLVVATLASTHFALSEANARQMAEARLAEREAVTAFLQDMLTAADPENALGERLTVLDVLDVARAKLDDPDALEPGVAAQLHRTLGNTYSSLGRGEAGLAALGQATTLANHTDDEWELGLALDRARALAAAGREPEALELIARLSARLDPQVAAQQALLFDARLEQAALLDRRGHLEQAEDILRELMASSALQVPGDGDRRLRLQRTLAMNLHKQGRYEASIDLARSAAEAAEARHGPRHPLTVETREIMALSLRDLARFDEAETIYRSTLALRREVLGESHPLTHQTRGGLAAVLAFAGQTEEAWTLVKQGYDGLVDQLGFEAETVRILGNLYAHVASQRGDYAEAIRVLRILVEQNDAMPGGPSATDLADYNNLAFNLMQSERCDEALPVQRRLLDMATGQLGEAHLHTALFRVNFATCLERTGEQARAAESLVRAIPVLSEALGDDHPRTSSARERLAELEDSGQ